jgi:IMP dehydrogenase
MQELFTFDDVLIVPKFSTISSRKDVDLRVSTNHKVFRDIGCNFPVISANMDTITDVKMAHAMLNYGAQACLHRFCTIEENAKMFDEAMIIEDMECIYRPMVSVGIGDHEFERAEALYCMGAIVFIVDVAHGAQEAVLNQVKRLRERFRDNAAIIVGNFATGESLKPFLGQVSIDGFKVGIGPGSACTTRIKTGVGYPQLSAVTSVVNALEGTGIPTIADGGMKTPGDIAKALGAGASLVMLGGMLAGTDETPGDVVYIHEGTSEMLTKEQFENGIAGGYLRPNWKALKKYRGSASKEAYDSQGKTGTHRTTEGESFLVPYKGSVKDVLDDIQGGLRSAFSYVGAKNLEEFHARVEFVRISRATRTENGSHWRT